MGWLFFGFAALVAIIVSSKKGVPSPAPAPPTPPPAPPVTPPPSPPAPPGTTSGGLPYPPLSGGFRPVRTNVQLPKGTVLKTGYVVDVEIQEGERAWDDVTQIARVRCLVLRETPGVPGSYDIQQLSVNPLAQQQLTKPIPPPGTVWVRVYPPFIRAIVATSALSI